MEIVSQELIQVRFTVKDGDREFSDALYFTPRTGRRSPTRTWRR
jgi:hypothetical protein